MKIKLSELVDDHLMVLVFLGRSLLGGHSALTRQAGIQTFCQVVSLPELWCLQHFPWLPFRILGPVVAISLQPPAVDLLQTCCSLWAWLSWSLLRRYCQGFPSVTQCHKRCLEAQCRHSHSLGCTSFLLVLKQILPKFTWLKWKFIILQFCRSRVSLD